MKYPIFHKVPTRALLGRKNKRSPQKFKKMCRGKKSIFLLHFRSTEAQTSEVLTANLPLILFFQNLGLAVLELETVMQSAN